MKYKKLKKFFLILITFGILIVVLCSLKKFNNLQQVVVKSQVVINGQVISNAEQNMNIDIEPHVDENTGARYVTYEDFGAIAKEGYDDYNVIKETHAFANKNHYEVRATKDRTYHIYKEDEMEVITIQTNTNWNNANIVIHDENINNKETKNYSIFQISSDIKNITLSNTEVLKNIKIDKQTTKIEELAGYGECLCIVYNSNKKQYIRSGSNKNSGTSQKDLFKIDNEGNVLDEIQWDFEQITSIDLIEIPKETITIENANFITMLPENDYEQENGYFARNIVCNRSNTVIKNINHDVDNRERLAGPYYGFIRTFNVSDVTIESCSLYSHKYNKESNYDLILEQTINTVLNDITSNDIEDIYRWGITGSNYTKDITYKNCVLNRIDSHCGVHNLTIEDCIIGVKGLTLIGSGELNLNNVTRIGGDYFIELRSDYGSTWNGNININNCTLKNINNNKLIYFRTTYDNGILHDYGYDLYLPNVYIEGLNIEDENSTRNDDDIIYVFYNSNTETGTENGDMRNNYNLPTNIIIKNYHTISNRKLKLFFNKFYNDLNEVGINFSVPLLDKEKVNILTIEDEVIENNTMINKDIKIIKNDVEGIETIIKINDNTVEDTEIISDEGNYNFEIIYKNSVSEMEIENINISIDKTAPKILDVNNGMIYYKPIVLNSIDDDIKEMNVYLNNEKIEYTLGSELVEFGKYIVEISDYAGNTSRIEFETLPEFNNNGNYEIMYNYSISEISVNTTYEEFEKSLNSNVKYDIYRDGKKLDKKQKIFTGDNLITEYGNKYYLIVNGDFNKDGCIDITDLLILKRYLLNMLEFDDYIMKAMDLNADRIVDITDLLLIKRILLGQLEM